MEIRDWSLCLGLGKAFGSTHESKIRSKLDLESWVTKVGPTRKRVGSAAPPALAQSRITCAAVGLSRSGRDRIRVKGLVGHIDDWVLSGTRVERGEDS